MRIRAGLSSLFMAGLAVFALVLAVFTAPAAAAPPERMANFQVPPGFVVERVAAAPLVRYPLFAAFDDRGRMFVAEGTGTNLPGAELREKKLGRILLLEDIDGDGTFDTSKVYADQLVFPQGVLWHDGALYTASHPTFWKLEDPDGKGVATKRTELITGFGFNGNGCDIHGPFLGPDGRLYWTDGRHGYKIKTRDGELLEGLASRIWRCKTDGTQVERICGTGGDNPIELDFTPDGEAIGTMDQGPGDCLLHYVEGGVYPMDHPSVQEFPRTGPLLGAVHQYSAVLPAALCGTTRYRSATLGAEYQNCFFSTQYMLHKIVQQKVGRDGSTFHGEDVDFLTCTTHDVRLTDVLEDADGSLLFVDMGAWFTYGFPGNPLAKPDALGAIYRIRRVDAPAVADPWGTRLALPKRTPAELVTHLNDPRFKVREQAVSLLAKQGDAAVTALGATIRETKSQNESVRRDAAWALCRIDTPAARAVLRTALNDPAPSVRLAAIHALGLQRDQAASDTLATLVVNDEPAVRRKAAESLGRIGRADAVPALIAALQKGGDRFLEHSIIFALIRINDRTATASALNSNDPRVRRAGLIALDQMPDGRLSQDEVAPLLQSNDPDLQRTALEVVSRRPNWSELTQGALRTLLASKTRSTAQEGALIDVLTAFSRDPGIQQLVADAVKDQQISAPMRVGLLQVMAQGHVDIIPPSWVDAISASLSNHDPSIRQAAVATVKTRGLYQLDRLLAELSQNEKESADLRLAALEGLVGRQRTLDSASFAFLKSQLADTADPLLRLAAARTIGASPLTNAQQTELAGSAATVNAIVLRLLLPLFAKSSDAAAGRALAEALTQSASAEVLSLTEFDAALSRYPAEVRKRAQPVRAKLVDRQKGKAAYLAQLKTDLDKLSGNADVGHEIFLSQKVGCYGCHRAVGRGGVVGPDLSRIGQFRSKDELLESLIFPDLTIAPEFRSFQVATRDGRTATGLVVRDAPDAITLRTTDLAELRVPRQDLEEMLPSTRSLMPEGLEKTMTRQELRDLLEFLLQQR